MVIKENEMQPFRPWRYLLFFLFGAFLFTSTSFAGDLAPSAPPAPTMKNLQTAEPRIPIDAYGFTITESGSYYLTRNIQMLTAANGMNVEADNVTIDLMGYTLSGNGAGSVAGIYMNGRRNVEVRNGTVRNFGGSGIYEADAANGKSHRVIDVRVVGNGGDGIHLNGSGHKVQGCTAEGNGSVGIRCSFQNVICDNIVEANGGDGIAFDYYNSIQNNTVSNNGHTGIYSYGIGNTIIGNTASRNAVHGIFADSSCLIDQNTAIYNDQNGSGFANIAPCADCTFGTNHAP